MRPLYACILPLTVGNAAVAAQEIERVSLDGVGNEIAAASRDGSVDLHGRFVSFSTPAGLVIGDATGVQEVYIRDVRTGVIERATRAVDGGEPSAGSDLTSMSADGSVVAFRSYANDLVPQPPSGAAHGQTYVYDRSNGEVELVSYRDDGVDITAYLAPRGISADGRFVLMTGYGSLSADDTDSNPDLYIRDRTTGQLEFINLGGSISPSNGYLSMNAKWVVFETRSQLTSGDTNSRSDTYLLNRESGDTRLASSSELGQASSDGICLEGSSSVSEDGRFVVFASTASDLIPGWASGGNFQIYRKDMLTGELITLSVTPGGTPSSRSCYQARVSAAGDVVIFRAESDDLSLIDNNSDPDIYSWSDYSPFPRLLSVSPSSGRSGNGTSNYTWGPRTFSGESFVFQSAASDLTTSSDTNNVVDVFIVRGIEADSDQDFMLDAVESRLGTDPLDQDTDDDGLSDGEEYLTFREDPTWREGPTGSAYRFRPTQSWNDASLEARLAGFELVAVGSQQENDWLLAEFGDLADPSGLGLWLGLNNFGGLLNWTSGEAVGYLNWASGEPSANVFAAFMGGPSAAEPGFWYSDFAGIGQGNSIWERPADFPSLSRLNPLSADSDSDGVHDGTEIGLDSVVWTGDLDFDGIPDVAGTDAALFRPDLDPQTRTNPLDADSDDDGLSDGSEDISSDGVQDPLETAPTLWDSDLDLVSDGVELGLTQGIADTSGLVFVPDADPASTTDPLSPDSDASGVPDGVEDQNQDGSVDTWETDPNDPGDEALAVYFSGIVPGDKVHIEVWNATPLETIIPAYSLAGPGPSPTGLGINVDLTRPIVLMDPFLSDASGRASVDRLPVPASAPLGLPVWMQAVEVPISGNLQPRASNPVLIPIGAN